MSVLQHLLASSSAVGVAFVARLGHALGYGSVCLQQALASRAPVFPQLLTSDFRAAFLGEQRSTVLAGFSAGPVTTRSPGHSPFCTHQWTASLDVWREKWSLLRL